MLRLLAFDTCLDKTYVTLYNGESFINKVILSNDKNYHSAYLISTIVEILKSENLTPNDIDYIVTDIGPGSFTGIRACVTVARMLAQQLDKKVVGVSSLEILSRILGEKDLVALDARKNKAYLFDGEIKGAVDLEEVDKIVANKRLITDNSLLQRFQEFTKDVVSYQQEEYQLGEILAKIAIEKIEKRINTDWRELKPLYIQPPPVFK
ncbi:MAG: tRNA (adenosine(37)-N6)-threonylcarbamoyltransferase complex dimerization subunit type 1 TsaB [Cyanobacteria bacterium SIG31]|nr:tRNA (adenosine(37)-N6)-threonylcarbamoyltransferase complex dimerization subunit type 1 TsaB [Cyanobacteria bacterium SIG31]